MSSSNAYPSLPPLQSPPPPNGSAIRPGSPLPPLDPQLQPPPHQDSLSTVDTDHHGLQALQYATAAADAVASTPGHNYPALTSPHPQDASHQQYMNHGFAQSPTTVSPAAPPNPATRQTRLRRACDMCSARKVKCDESGPPCRPCSSLNVECTFSRTLKRRGPPNRHAEAARAAKLPRFDLSFELPPHDAEQTLTPLEPTSATNATPQSLDAESIAPWDILKLLVDDFFTYIHPLIPFPHEPTFRQRFENRDDRTDPQFLALVASLIGSLVASFPRSARAHLKSLSGPVLFPRAITMIERCRYVAMEARGPMFLTKAQVTSDDAATSYFLGLAAGYTYNWKMCRRYMTESLSFIQEMGYHRRSERPETIPVPMADVRPFSHIEDQIGKRLFYIMLLGTRSIMQLGTDPYEMLIPPPTATHRYPDRPNEVDDKYIFHDHIMQQPAETLPLMTGFNKAIDIYMATNSIAGVDMAYGLTALNWAEQKRMLSRCLREVKDVTAQLPPDLRLDRDAVSTSKPDSQDSAATSAPVRNVASAEYFEDLPGVQYYPPGSSEPEANDFRMVIMSQPERRARIQYNIQQANIYVSELATRSFCVEYYMNLRDAARRMEQLEGNKAASDDAPSLAATVAQATDGSKQQTNDENINPELVKADEDLSISSERELIVQHLLAVAASIPQRHMEPNGVSLHNKIRQVASTLLNDAPERKGPLAKKAEEYLNRFMEILARLERTAGGGSALDQPNALNGDQPAENGWGQGQGPGGVRVNGGMTAEDEEQELRDWADLREHQVRFLQNGGFLGT